MREGCDHRVEVVHVLRLHVAANGRLAQRSQVGGHGALIA
jgi:hypothetical protein